MTFVCPPPQNAFCIGLADYSAVHIPHCLVEIASSAYGTSSKAATKGSCTGYPITACLVSLPGGTGSATLNGSLVLPIVEVQVHTYSLWNNRRHTIEDCRKYMGRGASAENPSVYQVYRKWTGVPGICVQNR